MEIKVDELDYYKLAALETKVANQMLQLKLVQIELEVLKAQLMQKYSDPSYKITGFNPETKSFTAERLEEDVKK